MHHIAATKYLEAHSLPIDHADFDKQCGVGSCSIKSFSHPSNISTGFSITPTELAAQVSAFITSSAASGWANLGAVIGGLKSSPELRWANPLEVKNAVETAFVEKFGPKTAAPAKGKVRPLCPGSSTFNKFIYLTIGSQEGRSQSCCESRCINTICFKLKICLH